MELPHDIWLEIFVYTHSCLFSASCRLVCREWKQLLDSPVATTGLWRKLNLNTYEKLMTLCEKGHLLQVQQFVATLGLTAEDIREANNYALYKACANGHLELAKWLADKYELTTQDVRVCHNDMLRQACENGHLLVALWLVVDFGLTAADAHELNSQNPKISVTLQRTFENGHMDVVKWLVSTFGTVDHRRQLFDYSYDNDNCDFKLIKWLVEICGLTADDVHRNDNYALYAACVRGDLKTAKYLTDRFKLTTDGLDGCLCAAIENGDTVMAEWLRTTFNLA
jgi:hypothetical protein